jgi:hypothetical protein
LKIQKLGISTDAAIAVAENIGGILQDCSFSHKSCILFIVSSLFGWVTIAKPSLGCLPKSAKPSNIQLKPTKRKFKLAVELAAL